MVVRTSSGYNFFPGKRNKSRHDTIGRISTMPEEGKRKEFTNPIAKREPAMKSNAAMGTSGKLSLPFSA